MTNWEEELKNCSKAVADICENLDDKFFRTSPIPGQWSVAENIIHLNKINSSYFPIFKQLEEGDLKNSFVAKIKFIPKFFGSMLLKSVDRNRTKKVKTFPIWQPISGNKEKAVVLKEFEDTQQELAAYIDRLKDAIDKQAIIYSPANKNIVYSLPAALDILVEHEQRHIAQMKELLKTTQQ